MSSENKNVVIAALEYQWWGVSIGGRHYTGEVHHPDGTHELTRRMDLREAHLYAAEEGVLWGRLERVTNKFESLADLERAAMKWCEQNLGDCWLLLHHDGHNPNHVIGAKGYSPVRLRNIERYQKMWWSKTDAYRERNWDKGYKIWNRLLEPA